MGRLDLPFADHETGRLHLRKVALHRDDSIGAGRLLVHLTDRDLGVRLLANFTDARTTTANDGADSLSRGVRN